MQVRISNRPANHSCYAVAGRLLFVESNDTHVAQLLERLFTWWQLSPVKIQNREPNVAIRCHVNKDIPSIPSGCERFEIAERAQCYIADQGFFVDFENSLVQLRSDDPVEIQIWLKGESNTLDANLARTLSFAVCAGLRRQGIFELHSAGLLAPDDESGVVLIGPSGSGKSTLTTQLAAGGWKYLSDDELLLTVEQDLVIARGFRSFFALSPEAVAATGVAIGRAVSGDRKTCFEPVHVFGDLRAETAVPRALFFTRISGKKETQVIALSRTGTMTRLLRACPWAVYDREVAAANLNVLSSLSLQSAGFDLVAGRDLLTPGYAGELLQTFIKS